MNVLTTTVFALAMSSPGIAANREAVSAVDLRRQPPDAGTRPADQKDVRPSAAPRWTVRTIDARFDAVAIQAWDAVAGLTVALADGSTRTIPTADVVQLDAVPSQPASRPAPDTWWVHTTDGERLAGRITSGDEAMLVLHHNELGDLPIPLERIRSLTRSGAEQRDSAEGEAIRDPQSAIRNALDSDRLWLTNGDIAVGLIDRIDARGVSLQTGERRRELKWNAVTAVRMANEPPADERDALHQAIDLADGSRLMAAQMRWTDASLSVTRLASTSALEVPQRLLRAVQVVNGRWHWLSDLPTVQFESASYFGRPWPLMRDRNVVGGPLRCGAAEFERGIGLHSSARAVWDLDGRYARFVAAIGIDDSGGQWSDADVTIRLDGRAVLELTHLRHGEQPRAVDVDLSGVKRLEIQVGFGENSDIQDRIDVCGAGLVRIPGH